MLKVSLIGASGRMGQSIAKVASDLQDVEIVAAMVRDNSSVLGQEVPHWPAIKFTDALKVDTDVIVDFSTPESTMLWLDYCLANKIAMVIGTTGLSAEQHEKIKSAGSVIPMIYAANTSVAVNLTYLLASMAAKVMDDADIEIIEAHHHHKKDAPSGTALAIGEHIVQTKQQSLDDVAVYSRHGNDCLRQQGEIGFSTIRGGDIAGEHTAMFIGQGERVEITQRATSRDTFAQGAIRAVQWLHQQPAGFYDMLDVLGLKQLESILKSPTK